MTGEELVAIADVEHWLWSVEREMTRYEDIFQQEQALRAQGVGPEDPRSRGLASERYSVGYWVASSGKHLVTTLRSPHVPEAINKARLSADLGERITNL